MDKINQTEPRNTEGNHRWDSLRKGAVLQRSGRGQDFKGLGGAR